MVFLLADPIMRLVLLILIGGCCYSSGNEDTIYLNNEPITGKLHGPFEFDERDGKPKGSQYNCTSFIRVPYTEKLENLSRFEHGREYPVLFVIPGKSYSKYVDDLNDACYQTKDRIVIVTINYRMGPLGFLALDDTELPGNYGLLDVMAALDWVHNHIQYFGGLKNKITVVGHGSGAVLASIILSNWKYQGVIHAGVFISGSVVSENEYFDGLTEDYRYGLLTALNKDFDCFGENWTYKSLKECLKKYPPESFYSDNMMKLDYRPKIDGINFLESIERRFLNVPIYIGITENEFGKDQEAELNMDHILNKVHGKCEIVDELIKTRYMDYGNKSSLNEKELLGDLAVVIPSLDLADNISHYHDKIYLYNFQHENIYHGFELSFLLGNGSMPSKQYNRKLNSNGEIYSWDPSDRELSRQLSNMFYSIANNEEPGDVNSVKWPKYKDTTQEYLSISPRETKLSNHPFSKKRQFWKRAVPEIETKLQHRAEEEQSNKTLSIILAACLGIVAGLALVLAVLAIWYHIKVGHLKEIIDMNAMASS